MSASELRRLAEETLRATLTRVEAPLEYVHDANGGRLRLNAPPFLLAKVTERALEGSGSQEVPVHAWEEQILRDGQPVAKPGGMKGTLLYQPLREANKREIPVGEVVLARPGVGPFWETTMPGAGPDYIDVVTNICLIPNDAGSGSGGGV